MLYWLGHICNLPLLCVWLLVDLHTLWNAGTTQKGCERHFHLSYIVKITFTYKPPELTVNSPNATELTDFYQGKSANLTEKQYFNALTELSPKIWVKPWSKDDQNACEDDKVKYKHDLNKEWRLFNCSDSYPLWAIAT